MAQKRRISLGLSSLAAWAAFSWLLRSVSPGLCFQDGSELCHAGAFLGVAHPPGFPLWVLAARTACLLPLGSWPLRVNLLSAGCIGLSCAFLSRALMDRWRGTSWAAPFAGLCLLWGERTWRQGLGCEVYALEILLVAAFLWRVNASRTRSRPREACLVFGLLLCAHPPMGAMMAPFFLFLWWRRDGARRFQDLFWLGSIAGIAMSCWLLLPLRSSAGAEALWADVGTWRAFLRHATRSGYPLERSWAQLGNVWPHLRVALGDLLQAYGWLVVLAAVLGGIRCPSADGAGLFVWVYAATPLALCFLMEGGAERWELMANRVFFLPGFVAASLLFGEGVRALRRLARPRTALWPALAVMALVGWKGAATAARVRLRPCWTGEDWGGLMRQVAQGPVRFLASTDSSEFMASFQSDLAESRRLPAVHRGAWGDPSYMESLDLLAESKRFPSAGQWFFLSGEASRLGLVWECDAEDLFPLQGKALRLPVQGPLLGFPPETLSCRVPWPAPWNAVLPDEGARSFFGHLYYSRGVERMRRGQLGAVNDFERCLLIEPDHLPCLHLWLDLVRGREGGIQ